MGQCQCVSAAGSCVADLDSSTGGGLAWSLGHEVADQCIDAQAAARCAAAVDLLAVAGHGTSKYGGVPPVRRVSARRLEEWMSSNLSLPDLHPDRWAAKTPPSTAARRRLNQGQRPRKIFHPVKSPPPFSTRDLFGQTRNDHSWA